MARPCTEKQTNSWASSGIRSFPHASFYHLLGTSLRLCACNQVRFQCILPCLTFWLVGSVPAGWWSVFGNPVIVAIIGIALNNFVIPKYAKMLCRIKHGSSLPLNVDPFSLACYRTVASTAMMCETFTAVLAPLLATFTIDDACLRFLQCLVSHAHSQLVAA